MNRQPFFNRGSSVAGDVVSRERVCRAAYLPVLITIAVTVGACDVGSSSHTRRMVSVQQPRVVIRNPATDSKFNTGDGIRIIADVEDMPAGAVVQFTDGAGRLIARRIRAPFETIYRTSNVGSHSLVAEMRDASGKWLASSAVTVRIHPPPQVASAPPFTLTEFLASSPPDARAVVNHPPEVRIDQHPEATTIYRDHMLPVLATATDRDGWVRRVVFFANGQRIGEAEREPYYASVLGPVGDMVTVEAIAVDDDGARSRPARVQYTVVECGLDDLCDPCVMAGDFALPTPTIHWVSPKPNRLHVAPASIVLEVEATFNEGTITKVDFLDGRRTIGTAVAQPYRVVWSGAPAGGHRIVARATTSVPIANGRFLAGESTPNVVVVRPTARRAD